jgi:hypothetical protein
VRPALVAALALFIMACGSGTYLAPTPTPVAPLPLQCNPAYWSVTYNPSRLIVKDTCKHGWGTVMLVESEYDGDLELRVVPDDLTLLSPGNAEVKNWLVIEIPCQGVITQLNAMGTCPAGLIPQVTVPHVGDRVEFAGPWVLDKGHGTDANGKPDPWAEIHGAVIR